MSTPVAEFVHRLGTHLAVEVQGYCKLALSASCSDDLQAEVCDEGLCRVGWSTLAASHDIGTDRHSFGYGGTAKKSHARQFNTYGEEYKQGDVVGCLFDGDQGTLSFSKNGVVFPVAFELPQYLKGQVGAATSFTRLLIVPCYVSVCCWYELGHAVCLLCCNR